MAASSMASAAASFALTPAISSNAAGNPRAVSVFFPRSTARRSLVVRAEEAAAPPPAAPPAAEEGKPAAAAAPKPPPRGPKKGAKVNPPALYLSIHLSPSLSRI